MPSATLSVLGKYQILAEIGRGGFATVYRARDLDLSRDVALKVLDPLLTRDPVWVARFRREARAVASLDHPRIVTIYEIGQAEGALYIAMKLLEGGSLAQRLAQQGPLPWPEAVRITGEIAEALDYAHGQGVLHRDLKPGNVLLDPRSGAVLTDFGFARLVADNSLSISMSGGLVGTPAYIAPEIWEGQDATAQTDIYALGCILYELVTGRTLFTGATPPAIMMAHFQPRAMPEAWPEGTPPGLSEVLGTALVRDPVARYARAGDLTAAVAALSVDRLAEPYASLEAAIVDSEWQPALALAAEIRSQRSDYRDVIALEQQALAGVAQAAREQQAAQWRQAAEAALAAGRLEDARLAAKQWQQLTTDDPELVAFAARLEQATLTSQHAASWREQAEQALAAGDYRGAGFALNKWRRLTPDDPAVATFTAKLSESSRSEPPLASQPAESPAEHASSLPSTELDPVASTPLADTTSPDHPSIDATEVIKPSTQFHSDDDPSRSDGTKESKWWLALVGGLLALIVVIIILLASQNSTSQPVPTWTPLPIIYMTATPGPTDTSGASDAVTSTLGIGSTLISEKDGMEMVYVPAGEFIMGSPEGQGFDEEYPQHTVYLDAFYIDKTEVTAAMYDRYVADTGYKSTAVSSGPEPDYPVVDVSWTDAQSYCHWAGKRLPTEAEWEKAARGIDGRLYPWGNDFDGSKTNFCDIFCRASLADLSENDGYEGVAPVGSYPGGASPYLALDMAGNVYEWVADYYDLGYYAESPDRNATGPSGGDRIIRGGAFGDRAEDMRTARRFVVFPDHRSVIDLGFRCAASATEIGSIQSVYEPVQSPTATDLGCRVDSPTLIIWAEETLAPVLNRIRDEVSSRTDICLEVKEIPFGDIRNKVILAAPAGVGPDIFVGAHDWLAELTSLGLVAEMNLGTKEADFAAVSLDAFSYDDKLYGLPYAVENVAFLCNTDLVPVPPTTYDELKTMSKEIMNASNVKQFFALQAGDPYHNEPTNTAFGGYIFGKPDTAYDACDVGLDSEGAIAYLTWLNEMVKAGLLNADVDGQKALTLFQNGEAGCITTGPWFMSAIRDSGINVSINAFPAATDPGSPFVGVQGFMVNAFSPNKVLAQSFLVDYVGTTEVMQALYTASNRPTAYLPARSAMDADARAFSQVAETSHALPGIPAMESVWSAWGNAIKTVMLGVTTPEEAAANAAKQVREAAGCR